MEGPLGREKYSVGLPSPQLKPATCGFSKEPTIRAGGVLKGMSNVVSKIRHHRQFGLSQ